MTKKELVGQTAFYINPKSKSNIKEIKKLEDGKVIVYLENGIIASADIVYLQDKQDILSVLDNNF
jgi:hypothetical protein